MTNLSRAANIAISKVDIFVGLPFGSGRMDGNFVFADQTGVTVIVLAPVSVLVQPGPVVLLVVGQAVVSVVE